MFARIYKPAKNAVQSGLGRTKQWILEYEPELPRQIEPLMGWTSSADTRRQVRLVFATKEEAIGYAERNGLEYRVIDAHDPKTRKISYSDNFRYGRMGPWTH